MAKANITTRTVKEAVAGDRDLFLWDPALSGFGLKVTPAGRKVYVFQYRSPVTGAGNRYTIGKHGVFTADQARKRAEQLAGQVASGIDPRLAEKSQRETDLAAKVAAERKTRLENDLVFEKLAAAWLDQYEHERGRRPSSIRQAKLVVQNHLTPSLAGKPMPHIGRAELQPIIDAIPAQQRGMRRAVFAYASVLFGWAAKRGDIPANPLTDMEKPVKPEDRDRVLTGAELSAGWKATTKLTAPFDSFFRLLFLTGQRRSEVAGMSWDELDRVSATWTIPVSRAKNRAAHIVPLSGLAIAELDRLADAAHSDEAAADTVNWPTSGLVLSTTGKTPISGISRAKKALDAAIAKANDGQPMPDWRIHDIRRTVATGFQEMGVRFEVTEAVLNHISGAKGGVAGIYQRHHWKDEKRSALDAWARRIETLCKPAGQDNVVSIGTAQKSA